MALTDKGPVCFLSGWTYAHLGGGWHFALHPQGTPGTRSFKEDYWGATVCAQGRFWKVFQLVKGPGLKIDRPTLLFPDKTG